MNWKIEIYDKLTNELIGKFNNLSCKEAIQLQAKYSHNGCYVITTNYE